MKKKIKISFSVLSKFLLSFSILFIALLALNNTFSSKMTSTAWDGNTIANSFAGGNGSESNPYQISNGEQLAYFKYLIENDNSNYASKHYIITDTINLGDNEFEPIGNEDNYFSGTLNGDGNEVFAFKQINIKDNNLYGLFSYSKEATIKNLNISDVSIQVDDSENIIIGTLMAKGEKVNIENISFSNVNIVINKLTESYIGGIIGDIKEGNINNVFLNTYVESDSDYFIGAISGNIEKSNLNNIVVASKISKSLSDNKLYGKINEEINLDTIYIYQIDDEIKSENKIEDNLKQLNENNDYEWYIEDIYLKIRKKVVLEEKVEEVSQVKTKRRVIQKEITLHDSGIYDNVVYVNDLLSDYDYYMGLNYTTSSDDDTPTIDNKNLYNGNNLVRLQINYSGVETLDDGSTLTGYVSLEERQNMYVYYKTLAVNDNGTADKTDDYIILELIDNPFTDRPTDKGFNNWVTDYQGAYIYYDNDYYIRYAKIPITYSNETPDDINISFTATWVDASVGIASSSFNNALTELKSVGMNALELIKETYEPYDMTGYYKQREFQRNENINGYYDRYGNALSGTCNPGWFGSTCTYYEKIENENYIKGETYYELNGYQMSKVDPDSLPLIPVTEVNKQYKNANMAGYYVQVNVSYNQSNSGYYSNTGELLNGTCNNRNGCQYYKLLQFYDENSNENIFDENKTYYYLTTRDTNIIVLTNSIRETWSSTNKPFTFTSAYNDMDYRNSAIWNVSSISVRCYSDVVIENMKISSSQNHANTTPSSRTNTSRYLYGNYNNVKIGRGITRENNYQNFLVVLGGNNSSNNTLTKYRLMIESGYYNTFSLTTGAVNSATVRVMAKGIYGNDYDRVNNNNDNLDLYYCASGSWGGSIYGENTADIGLDLTVKSGVFGSGKYDNTTGIYVGGRQYGTHYTSRKVTYEGGYTYNLIGGPLTASNRSSINDTFMYIKGGSIDMITGGAGQSATYGNRIVQLTGGKINYSVFAGSNGYNGSSSDGTVNGDGYIYVGGKAVIGDDDLISNNNLLFGAESGSVFGIGNGRSGYTSIGSSDNANIVIEDDALIKRNVYGGGNYGATGISSSASNSKTKIQIHGGTIEGNVYGGGNQNGSGSSSITSSIEMLIDGGLIKGSVYGGSNLNGTIYGDVQLNINGGIIEKDVYGGGYGGYQNSNQMGTYVTGSIDLLVDALKEVKTNIKGSVYGGSSFGTVNGDNNNSTDNAHVNVTVNDGIIETSVFGGGRGSSTYTPDVKGNITVNINGGNIGDVFGGNDESGVPSKDVYVYLNGGIINNAFGGGNNSSVDITNIYLNGSTVSKVYGGSNLTGDVTKTNVVSNSGTVNEIFGGNNIGGSVVDTSVIINGADILTSVYGGGNQASVSNTDVVLNKTTSKIPAIYGGGKKASVTNTNVKLYSGEVKEVYGGSNESGNIATSKITTEATEKYYGSGVVMDVTYTAKDVTWESNQYKTVVDVNVAIKNSTDNVINKYDGTIKIDNSILYNNYSQTDISEDNGLYAFNQKNRYYGNNDVNQLSEYSFTFQVLTNQDKDEFNLTYEFLGQDSNENLYDDSSSKPLIVDELYGGNNQGGLTSNPNITINGGTIGNIFGGGNHALVISPNVLVTKGLITNIYGGGNEANCQASTKVIMTGGEVKNSVYGGGNQGVVDYNTEVIITDATIKNSIYAGGNGNTATVLGNTVVKVGGKTVVGTTSSVKTEGSVFGGGNAAFTGSEDNNNSTAIVNIAGATIYGNVYGGANTSVVYGKTFTNIGYSSADMTDLTKDDIYIRGTVFGGGEANASGSELFDYSFISVTDGIVVNIDGGLYDKFDITGSIFGSGNASSTKGQSYINISNYGSNTDIKKNISIQRTNVLTIQNSYFELSGATDRTNEYSDYLYTLSRIDNLKLANDSSLYLQTGANLLKKFTSLKIDLDGEEVAYATIDKESKSVLKNVDNRLYMLEGKNLNIATNEASTSYGKVEGMTFFGMYKHGKNNEQLTGMYNKSYNYDDEASTNDLYLFVKGSYVLGLHHTNHDITKDGFYSNYDENGKIMVDYIEPSPKDSNFYMWIIGEVVTEYQLNLVASKYSTLGAVELPLLEFSEENTQFAVLDFNYSGLKEGVELINSDDIPRVASSGTEADNKMGLTMQSSNVGWQTNGKTSFLSNENSSIVGTTNYKSDNSPNVPTLLFYLYHSKNLETAGDLGNVTISLMAIKRIDDLTNETKRLVINIDMSRALYTTNDYEAGITPGRQYSMFAPTLTNITTKSSFSAYYSLYSEVDKSIYKEGYHRSLVSNYVLPKNTQITLIDLSNETTDYYYYVVDESEVTRASDELNRYHEITYDLSKFSHMGSTTGTNKYSDEENNLLYYDDVNKIVSEEFIVIVDFSDTSIDVDCENNSLLIELRNKDDQTIISVLGIEQSQMIYNLYVNNGAIIELDGNLDSDIIYKDNVATLLLNINFSQDKVLSNTVYDTEFFDQKLGIKISILDNEGNVLNGTSIFGIYYELDGKKYYPSMDGTTRIAVSDKVTNIESRIKIHTSSLAIASGLYKLKIDSFASPDGIYYGLNPSDTLELPFNFVSKVYGLKITTDEKSVILDKNSGKTLNGNNSLVYFVDYFSGLSNPNIRVSLYRRLYDKVYSSEYELIDLKSFINNNYDLVGDREYLLSDSPAKNMRFMFDTRSKLTTGTYQFKFSLYDGNNYIGDVSKYVIVE